MNYIITNLIPILAATVAGLAIGLLYGAAARHAVPHPSPRRRWAIPILAAVAEFWLACILAGALILAPQGATPWVMAIGSAVVIWIGFVLPALAVTASFRGQGAGATLGDVLHWLVVMVVQAAVLQGIGLTHP